MSRKAYIVLKLENRSGRHCKDFSMKAEKSELGVYGSKKNAEKFIAKCVEASSLEGLFAPSRILGFFVKEVEVDRMLRADDAWCSIYERVWSYTPDGRPFSYTPFSSAWDDGAYEGTPPDAVKFGPGDWAWTYDWSRFSLVKVLEPPYTPEQWRKKFKFASDASDDCYLAVGVNGHRHPPTYSLFPADEEIPARIKALIEDRERKYLNGESL